MAGAAMGDGNYQALLREASKYIGFPYRWGGFKPSDFLTALVISVGFIPSPVRTSLPRTSAQGIFDQCAVFQGRKAKPGDLVFFTRPMLPSTPVSHVGQMLAGTKCCTAGTPSVMRTLIPAIGAAILCIARLPAA